MRHLTLSALLFTLAAGCSKKQPPPAPADPAPEPKPAAPADTTAKDRAYWLNALKSNNPAARQEAADELAVWVETDPPTAAAVLELLADRSTAGVGKTQPARVTSTREAAALVLARGGPRGEAALKEKGLAVLRGGLADPDPAVREHTAHTLGRLGPLAAPAAADLQARCKDQSPTVRAAAFDALRTVGVADPVGLAALLADEDRDVVRLASELLALADPVPKAAVGPLAAALGDPDPNVRREAARALGRVGPDAAGAVPRLVAAIKKEYPAEAPARPDLEVVPVYTYWDALARIGGPAAAAAAGLLDHTNGSVRMHALDVLGAIGPPAKPHADAVRKFLTLPNGEPGVAAAHTLIRIGESRDEALGVFKRAIETSALTADEAIDRLPALGGIGKPLVPLALAQLSNRTASTRYAAVGLVGTLPATEAAKYAAELGKLAADPNDLVRRRAGEVLEGLGPAAAPAAGALAAAFPGEKDPAVREQLLDALMAMGPGAKPAVPVLLPLLSDEDVRPERRVQLLGAVAAADPASKEVAAALLAAAGSADAATRGAAAAALAALDPVPPEGLAAVVRMANTDKATGARVAALRALAAAGPKAKPVRADVEAIAAGKYPEFALPARVALAAMDGDVGKAAPAVRAGLSDRNVQVRAAAAEALLLVGPAEADLPALVRLLGERTDGTREAAARCVGRLGPAAGGAVPQLTRLLDDRDGGVRAAAAAALGEVGPAALPAAAKLKELRGDPQARPAARAALEKLGVREER